MNRQDQIKIGIDFEINQKKIKNLQNQLQKIRNMKVSDVMGSTGKSFKEAAQDLTKVRQLSNQVQEALKKAFNSKLNTTNLTKFKESLGMSGKSLADLRAEFAKIGPQGELAFSKIESQVLKMGIATKKSHNLLEKMGTTLVNSIKWAASSSLINNFTNSIQQAWGFTKSLDNSLNDIRIVTGKNADEMGRFAKQANQVAQNLGRTTTDYTKASLIYAQQGLNDTQISARTGVTMKVANVTGQTAEQVSEELTSVWNGYKVSAEQAEVYIDRLAAVAANSASSLQELSTGMSKVAAAAASLGVGEDQLAAQLSTIISVTRQAPETVGTALKTVYARITDIKAGVDEDGTTLGQYSGKLAEMGINVLDVSGNIRNMGTVIEEVGKKWETFSKEQQIYIAQTMAGQRQYSNLIALFDNFDKYNNAMEIAGQAAGTLQKQQSIYMDSIEAHLNQLTAKTEEMWSAMIDSRSMKQLIDFLKQLTNAATYLINMFGGGGDVLLTLGSIATLVFNKQIGDSVQRTIFNFNQMKLASMDAKAKIAEMEALISSPAARENPFLKDYYENYKKIYELQLKSRGAVSEEEIQRMIDANEQLKRTAELLKATEQITQQATQDLQNIGINQDEGDKRSVVESYLDGTKGEGATEGSYAAKINQAIVQQKDLYTQAIQELKRGFEQTNAQQLEQAKQNLQTAMNNLNDPNQNGNWDGTIANITPKVQQLQAAQEAARAQVTRLEEAQSSLNEKEKQFVINVSESTPEVKKSAKELALMEKKVKSAIQAMTKGKIKDIIPATEIKKVENFVAKLEQLKAAIKAGNITPEELGNKLSQVMEQGQIATEGATRALQKGSAQIDGIKSNLDNLKNGEKNFQDIRDAADQAQKSFDAIAQKSSISLIGTGITNIATSMAGLVGITTQFKNLGSIFEDKDISTGEKILKLLMVFGTTVPMIASSISNVTKGLQAFRAAASASVAANAGMTSSLRSVEGAATAVEAHPVIMLATTIAIGVVALLSAINGAQQKELETRKENNKATIESVKAQQEEVKQRKKLLSSLEDVNKQYQKGLISRADLKSKIEQLCEQYGIEQTKLNDLINTYGDLSEAIKHAKEEAAQEEIKLAYTKGGAALDTLKAESKNEVVGNQWKIQKTNGAEMIPAEVKAILQKNGFMVDTRNGVHYSTSLTEEGVGTANLAVKRALAEIRATGKNEYRDLRIYKELFDYASWVENIIGDALDDSVETVFQGMATNIIKKQNFDSITDLSSYIQVKTQAIKELKMAQPHLTDAQANQYINKSLKDLNKQNYNKYNEFAKYFKESFLDTNDIATISSKLMELNSDQLDRFFHLRPNTLTSLKVAEETLASINNTNKQLMTTQSLDKAANVFQFYSELVDKVKKGESITQETYSKLSKNLQNMFIKGLKGYSLIGNYNDFIKQTTTQGAKVAQQVASSVSQQYQNLKNREQYANKNPNVSQTIIGLQEKSATSYNKDKAQKIKNQLRNFNIIDDNEQSLIKQQNGITNSDEHLQEEFKKRIDDFYNSLKDSNGDISKQGLSNSAIMALASIENLANKTGVFSNQDIQLFNADVKLLLTGLNQGIELGGSGEPFDEDDMQQALQLLKTSDWAATEGQDIFNSLQIRYNNRNSLTDEQHVNLVNNFKAALQQISSSQFENFDEQAQKLEEKLQSSLQIASDAYFHMDEDLKDSDVYKLANVFADAAANSEELSNNLENNTRAASHLSEQVLRFNHGLQESAKNIQQWEDDLINGSYLSISDMKNAYQDILNLNGDALSEQFLSSEQNIKYLRLLLTGTEEDAKNAYQTLLKLASIDLQKTLYNNIDDKEGFNKTLEQFKTIIADAEIGDTLDKDLLKGLLKFLNQAHFTAEQAKNFFKGFQVDIEISGETGNLEFANAFKMADWDFLYRNRSIETKNALKSAQDRIIKEKELTKYVKNEVDLYHDVNIELKQIERKMSKLQKKQQNLKGIQLLNNLKAQNKELDSQINKLKQKHQIEQQDLIQQSSQLMGMGVIFNGDGSIANYLSIYNSKLEILNGIINEIRSAEASMVGLSTDSDAYKNLQDTINSLKIQQNIAQENFNNLTSGISKYDTTRQNYFDTQDKINELTEKGISLNLQEFKTKIQIKLDLTEAKRQWDDFVSNVLNRQDILNPNSFKTKQNTVTLAFKNIESFNQDLKNLNEEQHRYQEEVEKFQQARLNGAIYKSEIFNSQSEAMTALEETNKKIQDTVLSYADNIDSIKQALLDSYEDISDIFETNNNIYSFMKNQLNHDIQLADLLENGRGGRLKDSIYTQINETNIENIKQLRAQADFWANEQMRATDQATRKLAKQKWQETIQALNSATEQGIQDLKSKYENLITTISQQIEDKLTNGFGFDYFSTSWEYVKSRADSYLDPINAVFAIKDTEFNYQKVINDTNGLSTQQKLKTVMNQQLKILKQKDKLTQYDVDRANKILEIEKARIALEQARNNKTALRLKRDSQGNYSYQFTANQQAIDEAQNKLDKIKNDLYNLDLKAYQDNVSKIIQLNQETSKKIQEIYNDQNLSETARKQKLIELQQWYQEQLTFLTGQNTGIRKNLMQSTMDAVSDSFEKGAIDFEKMIDGWNGNTQKWIDELVKNPDSAFNIMKQGIEQMEQATQDYSNKSNEYILIAKDGYKTLKETGVDPLVASEKAAADNVQTLIDKVNEIATKAQSWKTGLGTIAQGFDGIKKSAEDAGKKVLKLKSILSGQGGQQGNNNSNNTDNTQYNNKTAGAGAQTQSNYIKTNNNITEPGSVEDKVKTGSTEDKTKTNIHNFEKELFENNSTFNKIISTKGISKQDLLWNRIPIIDNAPIFSDEEYYKILLDYIDNIESNIIEQQIPKEQITSYLTQDGRYYNYKAFQRVFADISMDQYKKLYKNIKDILQLWMADKNTGTIIDYLLKNDPLYKIQKINRIGEFDTGGYTGDWNTKNGKLAVLHEKELVLNKDDTENMLKILEFSRTMSELVQDNVLATLNSQKQYLNNIQQQMSNTTKTYQQKILEKQKMATQALEQQVKIEANFPSVTSHKEIEQAFSNLVNLATQKALKYNKN